MRRATHPKFGTGVVVEERREGAEPFLVIDFPGVGKKKLAARFVEIEHLPAASPAVAPDRRNPELEAAIARDLQNVDAYRAYGRWLAERHEPHGELILRECDPPKSIAPRVERDAYDRDVKRLSREALDRALSSPRANYTFSYGFVRSANVAPASVGELVDVVAALRRARVTWLLHTLRIDAPLDGGNLDPFWDTWRALGPFPRVHTLAVPSPGARGAELASVFENVATLAVMKGSRELRLPPMTRVSLLQIVDPSVACITDIAVSTRRLQSLSLSAADLDVEVLRALVSERGRLEGVALHVSAESVSGLELADQKALKRAFPKAALMFPLLREPKTAKPKRARPDPPLDLEKAMIDGEPTPLRRVREAMRVQKGELLLRTLEGALLMTPANELSDDTSVTIVHPVDLSPAEREAHAVSSQPFEQLARTVYRLERHRTPLTVHPIDDLSERAARALWRRGWQADFDDDAYDAIAFATERSFAHPHLTARVPHRPVYRAGSAPFEPADFDSPEPDGLVFLGAGNEPVPLGTVPARIFSEVMRDLLSVRPSEKPKPKPAADKKPIARVDRLFDRLMRDAGDLDRRADVNRAVTRLSPEAQELVALLIQGKVASDDDTSPALLDEIERVLKP